MEPLAIELVAPIATTHVAAFVDRDDGAGGLVGSFEPVPVDEYPPSPEGAALRRLRVSLDLSLGDAARAFGCTVVEASGLERGSRRCDFAEAERRLRKVAAPNPATPPGLTRGVPLSGMFGDRRQPLPTNNTPRRPFYADWQDRVRGRKRGG